LQQVLEQNEEQRDRAFNASVSLGKPLSNLASAMPKKVLSGSGFNMTRLGDRPFVVTLERHPKALH
jgi:hypothetical protein